MKKHFLLLCCFLFVAKLFAQKGNSADTLKESRYLPDFKLYTLKDSTIFTADSIPKQAKILFIYFNSDCDHCQHETEKLIQNIAYFDDIFIIMVSREDRKTIQKFYDKYELKKYPILVLMDEDQKIHDYFDFDFIPMIRQYDSKRKRIAAYAETAHMIDLYNNFQKAK